MVWLSCQSIAALRGFTSTPRLWKSDWLFTIVDAITNEQDAEWRALQIDLQIAAPDRRCGAELNRRWRSREA